MGLEYSIKIENNIATLNEEFSKATERALYAMGVKVVEGSVRAISGQYNIASAVDTGRLRASISFITPTQSGDAGLPQPPNAKGDDKLKGSAEPKTVVVGTNVEYAEYVHDGTSRMGGRPFIREGIDQTKDQMQDQVNKIFKGEL